MSPSSDRKLGWLGSTPCYGGGQNKDKFVKRKKEPETGLYQSQTFLQWLPWEQSAFSRGVAIVGNKGASRNTPEYPPEHSPEPGSK